jgi:hypothetical protein
MAESAFDKDFGYLIPFLDKVAASAPTLRDPAAREELARLMAGEKERWARIRELLAGAAGGSPTPARAASDNPPVARPGEPQTGATETDSFTVGSLRPRR